jgi:hypothetical protein
LPVLSAIILWYKFSDIMWVFVWTPLGRCPICLIDFLHSFFFFSDCINSRDLSSSSEIDSSACFRLLWKLSVVFFFQYWSFKLRVCILPVEPCPQPLLIFRIFSDWILLFCLGPALSYDLPISAS